MSLLLNSDNALRSGWKFFAYIAFFLLILIATSIVLETLVAPPSDQIGLLALNGIMLLAPAVGAMWLAVRFLDRRPFQAFGLGFLPYWRTHLLTGVGLAAAMVAILIAGCYAFGYVNMRWTAGLVPPGTLFATFGLILLSAANEELVFRGFPLQVLVEGIGRWPAILAMSLLFGALHLTNPNASVLGVVNTIVAGILLSLAYVKTRSLWLPYGIHIGWNLGLGFVFGFPLSGVDLASLWTTGAAGSETILGGGYGPEGGLLATFLFASTALFVERRKGGYTPA
jgi:membrane protease YdiL (CAAX protease family)